MNYELMKSSSIGKYSETTDNNFNLIRLICAWGVLAYHSIPLTKHPAPITDYIYKAIFISIGEFCVLVFFSISGFLIYRSITRSSSLISYLTARLLRIFPALFTALALSVFLIGPLVTQLSLSEYFSQLHTWSYFRNLNLLAQYGQNDQIGRAHV